jgi:acetyl esterase/lipase
MRRRATFVLVAVLALLASGCDLRFLQIPGDGPTRYRDEIFSQVTTTSNIIYAEAVDQSGNDVDLRLDMYEPTGDTHDARPAIVWVHGGGFRTGSKTSPEIVDQARTFARKGYVSVSISYRLSATGCIPNPDASCITAIRHAKYDAQAAVRWLRANADTYDIDPARIAVGGTSAGAITALNVGYGAADTEPGGSNPGFPSDIEAAVSLSGSSILNFPDPGEAAALLFHGTADSIVPHAAAVNTFNAAKDAGLRVELTSWEGAGHVPYAGHRTEIIDQTTNFLYWALTLNLAD